MRITFRKPVLLIAAPILMSASIEAQNVNFDAYKAQYEAGSGNTIFNKDLKHAAPVADFPFVLITGVKFKDCDQGVPTEAELSNLDRVSDSVYSNVTKLVKNIMAGTFTYQCERLEYYYVADTVSIRERLITLYRKHFSSYEPYINIKQDKNWDAYLKFLYPNEETMEYMQNEKILISLEKQGDKLDKARRVGHRLEFSTQEDLNCFASYATTQGFKADIKEKFKLHIFRTDKVDLPSISKLTAELRREAKKCNGIYAGWETVVVK